MGDFIGHLLLSSQVHENIIAAAVISHVDQDNMLFLSPRCYVSIVAAVRVRVRTYFLHSLSRRRVLEDGGQRNFGYEGKGADILFNWPLWE